jgi:hypothetical protein
MKFDFKKKLNGQKKSISITYTKYELDDTSHNVGCHMVVAFPDNYLKIYKL